MVINKYKDGNAYSRKVLGDDAVKIVSNNWREQFTQLMRFAQADFFNPDRPKITGHSSLLIYYYFSL